MTKKLSWWMTASLSILSMYGLSIQLAQAAYEQEIKAKMKQENKAAEARRNEEKNKLKPIEERDREIKRSDTKTLNRLKKNTGITIRKPLPHLDESPAENPIEKLPPKVPMPQFPAPLSQERQVQKLMNGPPKSVLKKPNYRYRAPKPETEPQP